MLDEDIPYRGFAIARSDYGFFASANNRSPGGPYLMHNKAVGRWEAYSHGAANADNIYWPSLDSIKEGIDQFLAQPDWYLKVQDPPER